MTAVKVYGLIRRIQPKWMEAIMAGARKHGMEPSVWEGIGGKIQEGDILFTWNRHIEQDQLARQFESRGAKVVCFENAYLKVPNTEGKQVSVGLGYHNNMVTLAARGNVLFRDSDRVMR